MRGYKIEQAPGKDLIPVIVRERDLSELEKFYRLRVGWHSYPIVFDGLTSYGLFNDLFDVLKNEPEALPALLDHSISIAEKEKDRLFINALALILGFSKVRSATCTNRYGK